MPDDDILAIYQQRISELEQERDNMVKAWSARGRELEFLRSRYELLHGEFEAYKARWPISSATAGANAFCY